MSLLKTDIEGADLLALRGAGDLLDRHAGFGNAGTIWGNMPPG